MTETTYPPSGRLSPLASILIVFGLVLVLSSVAQLALALPLIQWLTGSGDLVGFSTNPGHYPNGWLATMLVQALASLFSYAFSAWVFIRLIEKRNPFPAVKSSPLFWILTPVVVIAFIPFNGLVFEWNQLLPMPQWMLDMEQKLKALTEYLTDFRTPAHFLLGLLVIGVIPALGEEMLFRGTLQPIFQRWSGSTHVGILVAAAVFSAIHVQFMGFFPRMLLGALFGYLYVWSGNLWVPVWAHFVNNGFTVTMMHLKKQGVTDVNPDENVPLAIAAVSLAATIGILIPLYRNRKVIR
ncbi:CPBP family intramembrane glutamic endopeptidase [Siphonobacter aquaeclarae]|uniref:CAAX prenyl protease 2/Lysostaphin resistance protein A-like domain-containing protein n=1 Tax=Siphonobacter aquaeclarae TaxID=563176 RepID=A0A1G9T5S9_9BACT|nr:type II CAAX endopeptidase family protein [Siphonobacter aquaeclarae]SDM43041.1 hypothetical protein SAMN04488090_3425 [Siphonobacter aquaeclarae]